MIKYLQKRFFSAFSYLLNFVSYKMLFRSYCDVTGKYEPELGAQITSYRYRFTPHLCSDSIIFGTILTCNL